MIRTGRSYKGKKRLVAVCGAICGGWLLLGSAAAQEVKVQMADLPAAVQKSVQDAVGHGELRGLTKETENGKTTYEAQITADGHSSDVSFDAAGTVLETEQQLAPQDINNIPKAARAAILKAAAGGRITSLEAVTVGRESTPSAFEAEIVKSNGKKSEIRVGADGSPKPEASAPALMPRRSLVLKG